MPRRPRPGSHCGHVSGTGATGRSPATPVCPPPSGPGVWPGHEGSGRARGRAGSARHDPELLEAEGQGRPRGVPHPQRGPPPELLPALPGARTRPVTGRPHAGPRTVPGRQSAHGARAGRRAEGSLKVLIPPPRAGPGPPRAGWLRGALGTGRWGAWAGPCGRLRVPGRGRPERMGKTGARVSIAGAVMSPLRGVRTRGPRQRKVPVRDLPRGPPSSGSPRGGHESLPQAHATLGRGRGASS